MKWKWQAYSISNWFLVLGKKYLDCILAKPEDGCQRHQVQCCNVLVTTEKRFLWYHLSCRFKIFINVCFSVCKEEFSGNLLKNVLSFFYLEMLISAFLLRFKANYLKKMHGYPCGPCRDLLFLQGPHLAQKPLFSRHRPQVIFSRYF